MSETAESDTPPPGKRMVTVYGPGPGGITLIPVDSLPAAGPGVSVTPWGEAARDDWLADHVRFSLRWDARYAGMGTADITADACAIAARLLTEAGHVGAATLHALPIVELKLEYLVRPPKSSVPAQ
jgi:hypothetical protein